MKGKEGTGKSSTSVRKFKDIEKVVNSINDETGNELERAQHGGRLNEEVHAQKWINKEKTKNCENMLLSSDEEEMSEEEKLEKAPDMKVTTDTRKRHWSKAGMKEMQTRRKQIIEPVRSKGEDESEGEDEPNVVIEKKSRLKTL